MMFFTEEWSYTVIDGSVTESELQNHCKIHELPFFNDNSGLWFAFSHYWGYKDGLTESEALSFGKMTSYFFTGVSLDAGTDTWFKEDEIESILLVSLKQLVDAGLSEREVVKSFFFEIYDLYSSNIEDYTFKTEILNIRVSISMLERFMELEGKNKTEKFRNLFEDR